jgi:hypothetical protein
VAFLYLSSSAFSRPFEPRVRGQTWTMKGGKGLLIFKVLPVIPQGGAVLTLGV